jgi:hypothetical protein
MEITTLYQKERKEFGRPVNHFTVTDPTSLGELDPDGSERDKFVERNPVVLDLQAIPERSEAYVNTNSIEYKSNGMCHLEGGWPRDIDPTEKDQTARYRKKVEKDEDYIRQVVALSETVELSIMQNIAVDIYEDYFISKEEVDHASEPPSAKTLSVFKDPNEVAAACSAGACALLKPQRDTRKRRRRSSAARVGATRCPPHWATHLFQTDTLRSSGRRARSRGTRMAARNLLSRLPSCSSRTGGWSVWGTSRTSGT